ALRLGPDEQTALGLRERDVAAAAEARADDPRRRRTADRHVRLAGDDHGEVDEQGSRLLAAELDRHRATGRVSEVPAEERKPATSVGVAEAVHRERVAMRGAVRRRLRILVDVVPDLLR